MDDARRRALVDGWFRDHADRVLAYLLHRVDEQSAQDLLQEIFVLALRKAESVPEPPIGWLLVTARKLLANSYRGMRRQDRLLERLAEDAAAETDHRMALLKHAFVQTLTALRPADREVLTLSGWYGLRPVEAAAALGCSATSYGVRLHRARRRLTAHLEAAGYPGATPAGLLAEVLRD